MSQSPAKREQDACPAEPAPARSLAFRLPAFLLVALLIVLSVVWKLNTLTSGASEIPGEPPSGQAAAPQGNSTDAHEIRLALPFDQRPHMPRTQLPRLAIVIDDMGESMRAAQSLLDLDYPVTFSIWPHSAHAKATAEAARKAGREVMIHQPMQPVGYPEVNPGPGALFLGQSREEIMRLVTNSVNRVPCAVGINNHMGSRITQDQASMDAVADAIIALRGSRSLFVLDSLTHPQSKLHAAAAQAGIRSYRRDVFLDDEEDLDYILHQLNKAAQTARQNGQAIAIGHPLPATLEALKQWQLKRDPGILIVPLANLNP